MIKSLPLKIDFWLLTALTVVFIFATIIGTLSHEFGHYIVAKIIGLEAKIHYGYTSFNLSTKVRSVTFWQSVLITFGGPFQTIITGMIGLFLLYKNRIIIKKMSRLKVIHWLYVFLSLFWLRPCFNLVFWIIGYLKSGRFSQGGDEIRLANYFDLPQWSIVVPTAIIGLMATVYVIFTYIPAHHRLTFIISGIIGGLSGYFIWLVYFGKLIMP